MIIIKELISKEKAVVRKCFDMTYIALTSSSFKLHNCHQIKTVP